jgi:hypothetical protein
MTPGEEGCELGALRAALDAPDGFDRYQHRRRTEAVRRQHPHTVTYREQIDEGTCVTYALGLNEEKTYWPSPRILVGKCLPVGALSSGCSKIA